jgi:hypothetical protein
MEGGGSGGAWLGPLRVVDDDSPAARMPFWVRRYDGCPALAAATMGGCREASNGTPAGSGSSTSAAGLLLYLHGASSRGAADGLHLCTGLPRAMDSEPSVLGGSGPATAVVIVAPQCPRLTEWASADVCTELMAILEHVRR